MPTQSNSHDLATWMSPLKLDRLLRADPPIQISSADRLILTLLIQHYYLLLNLNLTSDY